MHVCKPYLYEHLRRLSQQILKIDEVTTGASLSTGCRLPLNAQRRQIPKYSLACGVEPRTSSVIEALVITGLHALSPLQMSPRGGGVANLLTIVPWTRLPCEPSRPGDEGGGGLYTKGQEKRRPRHRTTKEQTSSSFSVQELAPVASCYSS